MEADKGSATDITPQSTLFAIKFQLGKAAPGQQVPLDRRPNLPRKSAEFVRNR
jgi:hypothetical protein